MFREFARLVVYFFFKIFYRTEYIGLKNIPSKGAYILYANHISNADPLIVSSSIGRMVYLMAKEELFKNKILKFILHNGGVFPVKRGTGDIGAIKKALEKLKSGGLLCMFPEGTRRRKGKSPEPKPGIALLAVKAKCNVIPAAVIGVPRFFNKLKVIYGNPIDMSEYFDKHLSMEDYTNITKELMKHVEILKEGAVS